MNTLKVALCLAVIGGAVKLAFAAPAAEVTAVILKVTYQEAPDGEWHKVKVGTKLFANAQVRTAKRSKCEIRFPDGSRIRINERSDLVIVSPEGKGMKLNKGSLYARVIAGVGARISGASGVVAVKGTTITYDGQTLTTYEGTADHELTRGVQEVGPGLASDADYPGVYRVPGKKWAGAQLRPWFDTVKTGVTTTSTPGTRAGVEVRQARSEIVSQVQTIVEPTTPREGSLGVVISGVGTRSPEGAGGHSGLDMFAAGLPTAGALGCLGTQHGEPMLGKKFFGPYWDAQGFAILGEGQNNLVAGQTRSSVMGGDMFFGFGTAGHSDFPGSPATYLNELFATYRTENTGDFTVGRQYFLETPINNCKLGSLIWFDMASAARWQRPLGAWDLDVSYLWDMAPVSAADIHGWAGRLSRDLLGGSVAANFLHDDELSASGFSVDWSLPIWPEVMDFYGEIGEDPGGNGICTWGAYFPGLYQSQDIDLFVEHAKRNTYASLTSASVYWDVGQGWTGLLLAKHRSGEDTTLGIGMAKQLSSR